MKPTIAPPLPHLIMRLIISLRLKETPTRQIRALYRQLRSAIHTIPATSIFERKTRPENDSPTLRSDLNANYCSITLLPQTKNPEATSRSTFQQERRRERERDSSVARITDSWVWIITFHRARRERRIELRIDDYHNIAIRMIFRGNSRGR